MKRRKKIKDRGTEGETPQPNPSNACGHRRRRTDGKKEKEKKKRNRERVSNPATLDPLVASYDPKGSYGEPIFVTPPAHRGKP